MLPGYTQSAERAIKIAIKWAKKRLFIRMCGIENRLKAS